MSSKEHKEKVISSPTKLLEAVKGTYAGFDVRFREVSYSCALDGASVSGRFYYPAFRDGEPDIDEFVTYIYHRIIPFCLPRRVREEKDRKYRETGDPRYIHELTDQARNLFVRAKNSAKTTGEPGELILFILLEAALKAPQIACKMYLKTNEQVPVHGSDSIHIMRGSTEGSVCLLWGESKIYKDLPDALENICESMTTFLSEDTGRSVRDRDIDVVLDHVDLADTSMKETLLRFFDPYSQESTMREEAFGVFAGFDFTKYKNIKALPKNKREQAFRKYFADRIETACSLFGEKLRTNGLTDLRIHFFLIPFPSVSKLREKFLARLGVGE